MPAYASHYFNTRRLDAHTVEFCSDDYEEVLRFSTLCFDPMNL